MMSAAWRLTALPLIVAAILLVGAPNNPVLQRAIARAFSAITPATVRAIAPTTVGAIAPAPVSAIAPATVSAIAPATVSALAPVTVSALAPPDFSAFAPAHVSAAAADVTAIPPSSPLKIPLYGTFAVLQALDIHSTRTALGLGAAEANPMMSGVVNHLAAFVALKAVIAMGVIAKAEQMGKKSRIAPIVMMTIFNSFYGAVVIHNYRVIHQLR